MGNTLYHCESVPQNATISGTSAARGSIDSRSLLDTVLGSIRRNEPRVSLEFDTMSIASSRPTTGTSRRGSDAMSDGHRPLDSISAAPPTSEYGRHHQHRAQPSSRRVLPPALNQHIGSQSDAVTAIQVTQFPYPMLIVGARDGLIRVYI